MLRERASKAPFATGDKPWLMHRRGCRITALCRLIILCTASAVPSLAQGSSGQLTVTATILSSINLVFQNNAAVGSAGYCPLTNAGNNNVNLDLGMATYTGGDSLSCVLWSRNTSNATYDVSSAFDVVVTKANTSSPSYQLAVKISTVPDADVTWMLNSTTLTTSFTTIQGANSYGRVTEKLLVRVRNRLVAQTLTQTITFLATAN